MELKTHPAVISATIISAVRMTAQRVLRAASGFPSSKTCECLSCSGEVTEALGDGVFIARDYTPPQYLAVECIQVGHTTKSKKRLLARVRRMRGQTESLERALENESECGAVLQQIAAVRGALNGLMFEVLEGHIREHLGVGAISQRDREKDLDRIVAVLRSYMR